MDKKSFTLIELLIIIVILGLLSALISGNIINSLQKGRDARRKNDLAQIQRALELYYQDNQSYVTGAFPFGGGLCLTNCNVNDKVYMRKVPNDPNSTNTYAYIVDPNGQYYYLFSCIENYANDQGAGVSSTGYCAGPAPTPCGAAPTCGACGACKYIIGSSNALVISPHP